MQFQRNGDMYGRMCSVIPWIRYIFPNACGFNQCREGALGLYNIMKVCEVAQ